MTCHLPCNEKPTVDQSSSLSSHCHGMLCCAVHCSVVCRDKDKRTGHGVFTWASVRVILFCND